MRRFRWDRLAILVGTVMGLGLIIYGVWWLGGVVVSCSPNLRLTEAESFGTQVLLGLAGVFFLAAVAGVTFLLVAVLYRFVRWVYPKKESNGS